MITSAKLRDYHVLTYKQNMQTMLNMTGSDASFGLLDNTQTGSITQTLTKGSQQNSYCVKSVERCVAVITFYLYIHTVQMEADTGEHKAITKRITRETELGTDRDSGVTDRCLSCLYTKLCLGI